MKRLITIAVLALLVVSAIAPQTGCTHETEDTGIPVSESNRWLELLSILPENEVALKAAFLQDNAYLEEKKQQYPQITCRICNNPQSPIIIWK